MIMIRLTNPDGTFVSDLATTKTAAGDGFFAVKSISFSTEQTLNIGSSSSGAGAGKVTFNPFSFTLPSGPLDATLFTKQATGDTFKTVEVQLFPSSAGPTGSGLPVAYETVNMKLVAVKTISWSAGDADGITEFTLEYGSLVVAAPSTAVGALPKTVTGGWNRVTNTADQTLVTKLT